MTNTKEEAKCCHVLSLGHLSTVDGGLRVIFKLKNEQRIGRPSQDRALKVEMSPHPSFQVSVEGTRGKYSDLVFHTEEETWLLCESQISEGSVQKQRRCLISGCYAYLGRQNGSLDLVVAVGEGGMKLRLGIHLVMNVGRW